ncbi:MAG: immune inhibitor A [Spirochaetales bacterium]|nr:immune inhibitor A [Spirochaetales bacterium]
MRSELFLCCFCFLVMCVVQVIAVPADSPKYPLLPGIPFKGPEPVDGTWMLGVKENAVRRQAALHGTQSLMMEQSRSAPEPAGVGTEIIVNVSDSGSNTSYDETFVVTLTGTHGIILVTKEAYERFDGEFYRFANPNGDGSEPWLRMEDLLTPDQLSSLLNEFDTTIYPSDTRVFGEPLPRGSEGQKVWILLHNIRDEAYYDPEASTYVAGYFSASEDIDNNKNMMHIDTYDWANRTGPDAESPYLYEGVFAHEFQHLIHFDQDPNEPSWVDEGCADLAGYLCGYGHPVRHVLYYIAFHPITSLTFWGGGLADYGASYLFLLYLYEKYGGESFISRLVQEQANGIEGIENTLKNYEYRITFDRLFDNWTIANYLDDPGIAGGKYGYENIEIGSDDSAGYTIRSALESIWEKPFTTVPFDVSSDWPESDPQPYTAQYHIFYNDRKALLSLSGDIYAGVQPYSGSFEWYSEAEGWAWRGISQTFDIPGGGATLSFYTYFEIEEDWDYGYVEVYDYTTREWCTLESQQTTTTLPFPQDNPNTPTEREPRTYFANGTWHAFTGNSEGWIKVNMDLTPFAGHPIDLSFRTWQDGAYTLQMMYIDDISIPEIGFFDDVESDQHNWEAENWLRTDGKFPNSLGALTLTVFDPVETTGEQSVNKNIYCPGWHHPVIHRMRINPETQKGMSIIERAPVGGIYKHISIITNHADHIINAHYAIKAGIIGWPWNF